MSIIYKTGDLLTAPEPIIMHGCNAQGVMNSGVAKAVRMKYPEAYREYNVRHRLHNSLKLGQVVWVWSERTPRKLIGNAVTQEFYGRDGQRYVSYEAVFEAFHSARQIIEDAIEDKSLAYPLELSDEAQGYVAIPRIGAGLGGGDWDEIERQIVSAMADYPIVVYDLP